MERPLEPRPARRRRRRARAATKHEWSRSSGDREPAREPERPEHPLLGTGSGRLGHGGLVYSAASPARARPADTWAVWRRGTSRISRVARKATAMIGRPAMKTGWMASARPCLIPAAIAGGR